MGRYGALPWWGRPPGGTCKISFTNKVAASRKPGCGDDCSRGPGFLGAQKPCGARFSVLERASVFSLMTSLTHCLGTSLTLFVRPERPHGSEKDGLEAGAGVRGTSSICD